MPFYEYICESCEFHFESFQKMSDPPKTECPECGKSLRKVIFAPPIILRGSGFYETEYGRSQHNHPEKGNSGGNSGASDNALSAPAKSETSESKPAAEPKPSSESKPAATNEGSKGT